MATFEYVEVPVGATRLRSLSEERKAAAQDLRPAPKITTSLPHPSPPPTPTRKTSLLSASNAASLASPTISLIPQLLLSASLPPTTPTSASAPTMLNPRRKLDSTRHTLMSSKDPLSLPIMSTNFKRFITIVGPVFWLQDRVEEIVLWKKGWLRTATWMSAYSLICKFLCLLSYSFT